MSPIKQDKEFLIAFALYGAIGFQLAFAVVGGLWLGNYLDQKFGTAPWLLLTGLLLGSIAGFWNLIRLLQWKETRRS